MNIYQGFCPPVYTWGWELGVGYYGIALVVNLAFAAVVAGNFGQLSWWTIPAPILSFASLAYLVAVRDPFGER